MIKPQNTNPKSMGKPTTKQKLVFKIDVKPMNGGMKINQDFQGYTAVEILGMLELIRVDVMRNINYNPTIRDEKDDLL